MATVSIKIEGLDKLKGALLKSPRIVEDEVNRGIKRSVIALERTAKQKSPIDTGRMRTSHTTEFRNLRGELYPTTDYAIHVHEGTKFQRAQPWLAETATAETSNIEREMNNAVQKALNRIFK